MADWFGALKNVRHLNLILIRGTRFCRDGTYSPRSPRTPRGGPVKKPVRFGRVHNVVGATTLAPPC